MRERSATAGPGVTQANTLSAWDVFVFAQPGPRSLVASASSSWPAAGAQRAGSNPGQSSVEVSQARRRKKSLHKCRKTLQMFGRDIF